MNRILENFCNNKSIEKGLLLIDMPTGTGKTYQVAKFIASNYDKIAGNIFFITQLKKNLPEEEIRECFKNLGKEAIADDLILRVENNVDNLCKNFHLVKNELEEYIGDKLLLNKISREVSLINEKKNVNDDNMFLIQQARDDLQNELERELRKKVTAYLTFDEDGKERTIAQKKHLLEQDEKYAWITKLYPTTQTYKRKIFIMSLDKFLYRYSTIIEPPFNLYESNLLDKSVVFMDEFDGTKDVILNKIIKDGLDNQFGIIELFREIYVGFTNPEFTKLLTEESKYNIKTNQLRKEDKKLKSPETIIKGLKKSADQLYNDYKFVFQFKTHDDSKNGNKFLFQDYKTHTIVDGKTKRLDLEEDVNNSINWLKVVEENKSEVIEVNNTDDEIIQDNRATNIYRLINKLQRFLREFQTGVGFIADNYLHLKKERGKEQYNISRESSIRTVLSEFGIEGHYQNYLTINILSNAKRNKFDWKQLSDIVDASVYENGFRYYHIVDNENHDTFSKIDFVAFNDSPEKFLSRLINRTKVIGISATATLPTSLANYDMKYLKVKCKDLIYEITASDRKRLSNYFASYIENYNRVNIESKALGNIDNLSPDARNYYDFYAARLVGNASDKEYLKQRLLCFTEAVEFFFKQDNKNLKSFLYFTNSKGKEYYIDGENVLFEMFKKLQTHYSSQGYIKFLHGNIDEFERRKDEIQQLLKDGNRVFVISTYATMGAGQNIHYEYDFNNESVTKINNLDYNLGKKDFDAIYLEIPSNVLVNNFRKIETDEDFVKYIYQVKFLQEGGDYLPWEVLNKIRTAFINRESGKGFDHIPNRRTHNYLLAYSKVVQQAIGRICRTANKNKNIYVFYQYGLEKFIGPIVDYYSDKLINPEFRKFLDSCIKENTAVEQIDDYIKFQRLAETKHERSIQYLDTIKSMWNKDNIERWEQIREEVLKKPTISDLSQTEFCELYIEMPKADNKFYIKNISNDKNNLMYSFAWQEGYKSISAYTALLPDVLKIPGVLSYFKENGYATYFEPNRFMLSASVIKSIYQGALGEAVGRFVIKSKMLDVLSLEFENLPTHIYEKFDNKIKDVYFDFKNWNGSYNPNLTQVIKNIRRKMQLTEADKLVVVNILKPKFDVKPYNETVNGAILTLPYLYDVEKACWNSEGLKKLFEVIIAL
ncbi:MAG: hypothetical protein NC037_05895 [Bacteroides sp.]|nr:hypothetical protein [Bacillota bacterium]MCM1393375.1 hypothetical protein [[Eubacterium] siraeum]MCM1456037.1 hypothetical protein [Bacteroides sp.]